MGEIERKIRVINERARGTISTLPYEMLPKLIIIKLMHFCVMWMNSFPVKSGLSKIYSPRELVSRHKLDAKGSTKRTLCGIVLFKLNTFLSHVFTCP